MTSSHHRTAPAVVRATRATRATRAATTAWPAALIGLAAATLGYAGAGIPSYWGDEAASVMSAQRDWPNLLALLGNVDVVHGLYYALLHIWVDLFGSSEWSTRALSSIGVGLLAAGTVVLGTRWFGARVGLLAGVVCAILPRTTYLAVETRSYALAAAAAVWLTVALVALLRRGRTEYWRWALYGLGLAASIVLFLHLALLILVHTVAVAAHRPRPAPAAVRGWIAGTAFGLLLALPLVVAALTQRDQLAYLALRDWARPEHLLVTQWFVTPGVAVAGWVLALVGAIGTVARARRTGSAVPPGVWPVLAWVVLPTAVLLAVDVAITKSYSPRYVAFCVPAVAMLIALGIERVARAFAAFVTRTDASAGARAPMHPDLAAPPGASPRADASSGAPVAMRPSPTANRGGAFARGASPGRLVRTRTGTAPDPDASRSPDAAPDPDASRSPEAAPDPDVSVAPAARPPAAASAAVRHPPDTSAHPVAATVAAASILTVCAAIVAPTYLEQRTELAKDGGADFRAVADHVREEAQPGDAVVFGLADRRSREPRLALRLYPDAFAGLVDAQLVTPFDALPGLWDEVAPLTAVAPDLDAPTVWAVDATGSPRGGDEQRVTPIDPAVMAEAGYRLAGTERFARLAVSEYVREP